MQDDGGSSRSTRSSASLIDSGLDLTTDIGSSGDPLPVEVTAAVIALRDEQPVALVQTTRRPTTGEDLILPAESYRAGTHISLEDAIRDRIVSHMGLELGHIEQLSTDVRLRGAERGGSAHAPPRISIGYLALIRADGQPAAKTAPWVGVYDIFPWEDWRRGRPEILASLLVPKLIEWAAGETDEERTNRALSRHDRLRISFAIEGGKWDDERVSDRLALLDEAGLVDVAGSRRMRPDHRRTLATALARLRAKIRNRPLVFELLPPVFTLFELQKTVEAILGPHLHKQNFRRLVEGTGLVEATGEVRTHTGGRPAKLFRFRREVLLERPAPGVRVKAGRAA